MMNRGILPSLARLMSLARLIRLGRLVPLCALLLFASSQSPAIQRTGFDHLTTGLLDLPDQFAQDKTFAGASPAAKESDQIPAPKNLIHRRLLLRRQGGRTRVVGIERRMPTAAIPGCQHDV